jgi:hypothetical protein
MIVETIDVSFIFQRASLQRKSTIQLFLWKIGGQKQIWFQFFRIESDCSNRVFADLSELSYCHITLHDRPRYSLVNSVSRFLLRPFVDQLLRPEMRRRREQRLQVRPFGSAFGRPERPPTIPKAHFGTPQRHQN